ncbi:uncharacterized protein [Rutidosis leptorrhynchoides]|uniref:uncharacterized protein n=1 Tax=Rutidosis leptorrhynchoides TaxID=125765 RepID=UPI003A994A2A
MAIVEGAKETWMTPYLRYLHDGGLPIDKAEARRIRVTAPMYEVVNGALYRKSYNGPLLRCLTNDEALKVVKEMHEGVCSQHSGFRTVASRIMRQGYFWPSLYRDVAEIIKTSKALAKITGENVKKFVWHDIVCRYGVPNEIVSDNGKQFVENPFRSWCEELGIKQNFTSVAHHQANGQVEVTNKEIVAGIKLDHLSNA